MSINRILEGLRYEESTGRFLNSKGRTIQMFKGSPPIGSMWFLCLGGEVYQADTILYKLMTGKWVSSFRYKDGDSFHLSMSNIEPLTPKPTYQLGPQSSPRRGAGSNGEHMTAKEGCNLDADVDPTAGRFSGGPDASSDEQALKLDHFKKLPQLYLFADGHLLNGMATGNFGCG